MVFVARARRLLVRSSGLLYLWQRWLPFLPSVRFLLLLLSAWTVLKSNHSWFGKNSSQGKLQRLLGEIQIHMRLKVSGDRREIRQQYLPMMTPGLVDPLIYNGAEGVEQVIAAMDEYYLTKEDWDAIVELSVGPAYNEETLKKIPSAVKSAFTRTYNKADHPVAYYRPTAGKPKKVAGVGPAPDLEDVVLDDVEGAEEDEDVGSSGSGGDDDLAGDKLIKNKAPKKAAAGKGKAGAAGTTKKAPAKKAKK